MSRDKKSAFKDQGDIILNNLNFDTTLASIKTEVNNT